MIIISQIDFIPMWDGRVYFDELALAMNKPFNLFNFNMFRHTTMLYMILIAIPQYFDFGNNYFIHGVNLILGILAIFSFNRIVIKLFPAPGIHIERGLLILIFSVSPLFLATALNLNPDYGVLVFFLFLLSMLLSRKKLLSLLAGLFLVFSKETGFLLYTTTMFLFFICFIGQSSRSTREKCLSVLKWGFLMLLPPLLYCFYLFYNAVTTKEAVLWQDSGNDLGHLVGTFTSFSLLNQVFLGYLRGIFIINFNWILSLFSLGFIGNWITKKILGIKINQPVEVEGSYVFFFFSLFSIILFLLTRYSTFTNLRYFLPIFPFLLIIFYYSLIYLINSQVVRRLLLSLVFLLLLISNFRTIDPLSKKLFGTFQFGNHTLLNMTKFTGECCGYGRDQLVYNLEYIQLHRAQNEIYQYIKPTFNTVIVANPQVDWHFIGKVDENHRRTIKEIFVEFIVYYDAVKIYLSKNKPEVLYYLDYPNFNNAHDVKLLSTLYTIAESKIVGEDGYSVTVHKMILKH